MRRPIWNFSRQPNKFGYLNNPNWVAKDEATPVHTPCGYWFRNPFPPPEPSGFYPAYKVEGGWVIAEWSNLSPIRFYPDEEISLTWDYNYNTLYLIDYETVGDPDYFDDKNAVGEYTNAFSYLSRVTINSTLLESTEFAVTGTKTIAAVPGPEYELQETTASEAVGATLLPGAGYAFSFESTTPEDADNYYYGFYSVIYSKYSTYKSERTDHWTDYQNDEIVANYLLAYKGDRGVIASMTGYGSPHHQVFENKLEVHNHPPYDSWECWVAKRREDFETLRSQTPRLNPLCRQQDETTYTEDRYFCDGHGINLVHEKRKVWAISPEPPPPLSPLEGGYDEGIVYKYFELYNLYGPDTAVTYSFPQVSGVGRYDGEIEILGHKSLTELRIVHISPYGAPWEEPVGEGIWPSNLWCAGSYDPPGSWPQTTSAYIACYSSVDGSEVWSEDELSTESEGTYTCYEYNRPFQMGDYVYYAREVRTGSGETWTTEISIVRRNATTGAFVNETAVLASSMISMTTDDYTTIIAYIDGVPKRYTAALVYVEDLTDPTVPIWDWAIDGVTSSSTEVSTTSLWKWDAFEQQHLFHSEVLQPVPFIPGSAYSSYPTLEPIPYQPPPE